MLQRASLSKPLHTLHESTSEWFSMRAPSVYGNPKYEPHVQATNHITFASSAAPGRSS